MALRFEFSHYILSDVTRLEPIDEAGDEGEQYIRTVSFFCGSGIRYILDQETAENIKPLKEGTKVLLHVDEAGNPILLEKIRKKGGNSRKNDRE